MPNEREAKVRLALLAPESENRTKLLGMLEVAKLPVVIEMLEHEMIMEFMGDIVGSGANYALVAGDFGTGIVGVQDGSLISLKLKRETEISPIGLSTHALSGAIMNFDVPDYDGMINILSQWNR